MNKAIGNFKYFTIILYLCKKSTFVKFSPVQIEKPTLFKILIR